MTRQRRRLIGLLLIGALTAWATPALAAWQPTKPIEFVIPAGTGGGADQMARLIAGKAKNGTMKMGGTGSAQEDQIITIMVEQALGVKFTYVPFKGGGEVCVNLVGKHVDSTVNNPIECVSHWKAGRVRPLAVFDSARIPVAEWKDIPTVKEALGTDIEYLMLRGIFGAPDMPKDAIAWYVAFLRKVFDTPDFKKYVEEGALKPAFATGAEYVKWLEENESLHKQLMAKGGLLK